MLETKSTLTSIVKSALYKACFCLGLGTAAYYSYVQIETWVDSGRPELQASKNSDLQSKLIALQGSAPRLETGSANFNDTAHQLTPSYPSLIAQNLNTLQVSPLAAPKILTPSTEALTTTALPSPSVLPSVSPSPDPTLEAKEGDIDGTAQSASAMASQSLIPESQAAAFGYVPGYGMTPHESDPSETPRNAESSSHSAQAAGGTVATGIAPPSTPAGTGSNGASFGNPAPQAVSSNIPSSFLSQADLSLLTNSMKASFTDQIQDVAGLVCTAAMNEGMVTGCRHQNHASVHTSRWDTVEGLSQDAGFSIRSSSGSSQLEVTLTLKVQNLQQNYQNLIATTHPTEVLVHGENRGGRNYRVFELKMPNLNMRGTDHLNQVVATLIYEVSPQGSVLSSESSVSFSRGHFHTSQSAWDSTQSNRAPAANENVVVPEQLSYSIKLEKS